ncbi:hypothetical protein MPER_15256, partial [Moniliophthora perniciosa FA553]
EGIEAAKASSAQNLLASTSDSNTAVATQASMSATEKPSNNVEQNYSKKRVGEGDIKLDPERLVRAVEAEKKRGRGDDDGREMSGKKRKGDGGTTGSHDVTEEELEAYRMSRRMTEDPMANYVDRGDY